jgi:peptidoglycan/LPS O-acetylase OafA/YrhL
MGPGTQAHTRIAALDGLRALAALSVLGLHVWLASGSPQLDTPVGPFATTLLAAGYVGVDFFFVLSGFVLFLPICLNGGRLDSVPNYFLRRAARILPLYWTTLVVAMLGLRLFTTEPQASVDLGTNLLLHLTFLFHPIAPLLGLMEGFGANPVVWTLPLEVAFYLLLPLVALRFHRRPELWFGIFVAVSALWRFAVTELADPVSQGGPTVAGLAWITELPTYLTHFALGMAAALLYTRLSNAGRVGAERRIETTGADSADPSAPQSAGRVDPQGRIETKTPTLERAAVWLLGFGSVGVLWGTHLLGVDQVFKTGGPYGQFTGTLPVTVAFTCVLLGLLLGPRWARRPFEDIVLRRLGKISYGIYLWHFLVIGFLATNLTLPLGGSKPFVVWYGLVLTATLLLAWGSHVAIERPVIRWARRRTNEVVPDTEAPELVDPGHPGGAHGAYVAFAAYVLFLAVLLMSPHPIETVFGVNLGARQHWAEEIGNVLIFIPIGWVAARQLPRRWQAFAVGVGIACAAEFIQWAWLPDRTPSFDDIVKNSLGTAIGVLLHRTAAVEASTPRTTAA